MGRATEYITDFIERSSMHALTDAERATVKKTVGNALMELVLDNVEELNTRHEDPNAREPLDAASIKTLSGLVLQLTQVLRAQQGALDTQEDTLNRRDDPDKGMYNKEQQVVEILTDSVFGMCYRNSFAGDDEGQDHAEIRFIAGKITAVFKAEQQDDEETARHAIWNMMRDTGQAMPGVSDAEMVAGIDAKITEMLRAFVEAQTRYDMVDPTGMGLIPDEPDTDEERDTDIHDEREGNTNTKDACDDCCATCSNRHLQEAPKYPEAVMVVALSLAEGIRYPSEWLSTCPYCKQQNCRYIVYNGYTNLYRCDNCDIRWVVTLE